MVFWKNITLCIWKAKCLSKCIKLYFFQKNSFKKCDPNLPKIFRPVTRSTFIFLFGLVKAFRIIPELRIQNSKCWIREIIIGFSYLYTVCLKTIDPQNSNYEYLVGILQVLRFEFQKFRILEILNFHLWKHEFTSISLIIAILCSSNLTSSSWNRCISVFMAPISSWRFSTVSFNSFTCNRKIIA